ncbi:MAG: hypothetical protein Q9169_008565, partial [Polycauliona sp. 2 TL-2023]
MSEHPISRRKFQVNEIHPRLKCYRPSSGRTAGETTGLFHCCPLAHVILYGKDLGRLTVLETYVDVEVEVNRPQILAKRTSCFNGAWEASTEKLI